VLSVTAVSGGRFSSQANATVGVVKREIAEIQAQEKPTTENPGLFGQHSPSHPGLRALQDWKRQLEHVVKLLEGELGKT